MMVSTKGRYALRVMIDLAENAEGDYTPMKNVAERQEISLKYLERIMPVLSKNKLVEGIHGKGGGYRLNRPPKEYSVGEILRLTEGDLAPVACLKNDADACQRADGCRTLPMWDKLNRIIGDYLDSVTLADLMDGENANLSDID
ncbi:RrF2 family transcriptional regulator [Christensenellaceae bacterium OttesenSCG-928-M15]|nr:RrF2 family transcriptional regulator [Christensenellaceae bacterium OttesenSCG-928-M15]